MISHTHAKKTLSCILHLSISSRCTYMAHKFAPFDCGGNNRFTLAGIMKHPLERIDISREDKKLIEYLVYSQKFVPFLV